MTLQEYIEIMIPMVKVIYREEESDPKNFKRTQLWYIYRQYFYGFAKFINRKKLFDASISAQKKFEELEEGKEIVNEDWGDQPRFDPGRKIFNLDHIYTGSMFRNALKELDSLNKLNVSDIEALIQNNYRMAWILKEEEKRLPRFNRNKTLNDALQIYESNGIHLIKYGESQ